MWAHRVSRAGVVGLCGLLLCVDGQAQLSTLHSFRSGFPGAEGGWAGPGATAFESAGDVDADGHADIIVGLPMISGLVRVYSGKNGAILHQFEAPLGEGGFGQAVASAGDVDGDGRADLIVGSGGMARVYSGATGALLWMQQGPISSFGFSVSSAGDLNGDGNDDVLVGSGVYFSPSAGGVWAYSVRDGALLLSIAAPLPGTNFGVSVSGGHDLDGDGVPDLIVGDDRDGEGGQSAGAVWVFSGATGGVIHKFKGGAPYTKLGFSVDTLGDLDGDGRREVLATSLCCVGGQGPLNTFVWSGGTGALIHSVGSAGDLVSGMDDVNGDGVPDFTSGHHVRSGANGALILSISGTPASWTRPIRSVGDVDGDGWPDVARRNDNPGPPPTALDVLSLHAPAPAAGSVLSVGEGCAPPSGPPAPMQPALSLTGALVPGGSAALSLVGVASQSLTVMIFGLAPDDLPLNNGCQLMVAPPQTLLLLPTHGVNWGWASMGFRVPNDLSSWPEQIYVQALTLDPSLFLGYSVSELLEVTFDGN